MTDKLYVAYTNTDLTEGRGFSRPIAHSFCEATVKRLAVGKGVMGCDANVYAVDIEEHINGRQYIPLSAVFIHSPTKADIEQQHKADAKAAVIAKARAAGLSEEELAVLVQ